MTQRINGRNHAAIVVIDTGADSAIGIRHSDLPSGGIIGKRRSVQRGRD